MKYDVTQYNNIMRLLNVVEIALESRLVAPDYMDEIERKACDLAHNIKFDKNEIKNDKTRRRC